MYFKDKQRHLGLPLQMTGKLTCMTQMATSCKNGKGIFIFCYQLQKIGIFQIKGL